MPLASNSYAQSERLTTNDNFRQLVKAFFDPVKMIGLKISLNSIPRSKKYISIQVLGEKQISVRFPLHFQITKQHLLPNIVILEDIFNADHLY